MPQTIYSPTQLLQYYRDAWTAFESVPTDATAAKQKATVELDFRGNLLWETTHPLVRRLAQQVMRGGAPGRDIANADELAQVASIKLFSSHPILSRFDLTTSLDAYLTTIIKNVYRDDLLGVHGRSKHMPRIYVDINDPIIGADVKSERRTQSGYFALKQMRHQLDSYLRQLPGSMVKIVTGSKTKTSGFKMVRLTKGHADLLRQWMAGEGDSQWADLAIAMGRPAGTVKRWFTEVTRYFLTDPSADATTLRGLFNVKPEAILAEEDTTVDSAEDSSEQDEQATISSL